VLSRRALLLGLSAVPFACSKKEPPAPRVTAPVEPSPPPDAPPARGDVRVLQWDFEPSPGGSPRAAIVVPAWGGPDARFPVLIALHGRGEAQKAPEDGAMGWPRDYAMLRAIRRLCAPPLTEADLEGFVEPARLADINEGLARRPFHGLVVACPYMPDLNPRSPADVRAYGRFLIDTLLPRLRREAPVRPEPEATGIDGVSLGGVTALRIGLTNPSAFGAVGGIQPAVAEDDATEFVDLAKAAIARRPSLKLRLLTSHDDYFRKAVGRISQAWRAAGVAHDFADVPGPHDYAFNRGPGSIELLNWHDHALADA
jgi:hypothetical protein